jgi:hypothetical protein
MVPTSSTVVAARSGVAIDDDGAALGLQIRSECLIMPDTCPDRPTARRLACLGRGSSVPLAESHPEYLALPVPLESHSAGDDLVAMSAWCSRVLLDCSSHRRLYGGAAQYSRW